MVAKISVAASALALAGQFSRVSASTCFKFGIGPFGTCNVDPRAAEKFQAYLNFPGDDATCDNGGDFDMSLVYTDIQGNIQTAQAVAAETGVADAAVTVGTVNFNVPLTSISAGLEATMFVTAYNDALETPFVTSVLYTQAETPSIAYVTSTTVRTAYASAATTITSSVTGNRFATTTPGYLRAATVTTKTATAYVQPYTTLLSTITVDTLSATKWATKTVSGTFSCNPLATVAPLVKAKRNLFDATNSAPSCAVPTTTYVTNKVQTAMTTVTGTNTVTVLASTVTTKTITATKKNTKFVGATTTVTSSLPLKTITNYKKATRATVVVPVTRTVTNWVKPSGLGNGACKPVQTYSASAQATISAVAAA